LKQKDVQLYTANGILNMLDRNRRIKKSPQRWHEERDKMFDVVVTCEERCFDAVCEDLLSRGSTRHRPTHVINMEIKDNHEDAMIGGRLILQLAQMVGITLYYE
jgi:RNA polymerase II subunit A C-terminal domain phosphatase SSU72